MKIKILTILFLCSIVQSNAQWINSITLVPSNPTTTSQIKVLAALSFSSGSCDDHTQSNFISGTTIYASALHCLGPLSFICNYTDTFTLGQLAAGNYRFLLNVNEGASPSPCTPGIVPGPSDSLHFTVSALTILDELKANETKVNYNSFQKTIDLNLTDNHFGLSIQVISADGRLLQSVWRSEKNISLDAASLKPGLYLIRVIQNSTLVSKKVLIEE